MGNKSVETKKFDFRASWTHFALLSPNNVDFSISSIAETTAPATH